MQMMKKKKKKMKQIRGHSIYQIILYVRQTFEDALVSKYATVMNMAWLYMQGLYRVVNMSEYSSIYRSNA